MSSQLSQPGVALHDDASRGGLRRPLAVAFVLALLASLLPPLLLGAAQPAGAQQEMDLSSDGSTLSIEPAVISSGTIGEEITLTVDPGPWPDEFELLVFEYWDFELVDGILAVRSISGNELVAVFTDNLPDGRYEVSAQEFMDGFGGQFLG